MYSLTVFISSDDTAIDLTLFLQEAEQRLLYLEALTGSFGRTQNMTISRPCDDQDECDSSLWVQGTVLISIGKARAEYLIRLYQAIARLIALELPAFEVRVEIKKLQFS